MRGRVAIPYGPVCGRSDHLAIAHDHACDRNLAGLSGCIGRFQRQIHEGASVHVSYCLNNPASCDLKSRKGPSCPAATTKTTLLRMGGATGPFEARTVPLQKRQAEEGPEKLSASAGLLARTRTRGGVFGAGAKNAPFGAMMIFERKAIARGNASTGTSATRTRKSRGGGAMNGMTSVRNSVVPGGNARATRGIANATPGIANATPGIANATPGIANANTVSGKSVGGLRAAWTGKNIHAATSTSGSYGIANATRGIASATRGIASATQGIANATQGIASATQGVASANTVSGKSVGGLRA